MFADPFLMVSGRQFPPPGPEVKSDLSEPAIVTNWRGRCLILDRGLLLQRLAERSV